MSAAREGCSLGFAAYDPVRIEVASSLGEKKVRLFTCVAALVMAMVVVGCTSAPIMNVDSEAVSSASGKPLTQDEVRGAIIRAGTALGWQMKDEGPNKLIGTLTLRTHTAVVEIPYSATRFSIKYRSSVNLNESGGKIHKNYNGWIQNLNRGINAQISAL
jgi:hypothetical protein